MRFLQPMWDSIRQSQPSRIGQLALFFTMWMPLWLVIGRAWADIAVCVVVGLFLIHSFTYKHWQWLKPRESKILLCLWCYLMLQSVAVSSDHNTWLLSLLFGRFLLFYLALRFWIFARVEVLPALLSVALPVLVLVAVDTYWQYVTGVSLTGREMTGEQLDRLTGTLSHPNIGNYFFKIALPMVAGMLLINHTYCKKRYVMTAFCMGFLALLIPLSGERSITIALIVAICTGLLIAFLRMRQHRCHIVLVTGVIIMLAFVIASQPVVGERSALFIQHVGNFWNTVYGQLFLTSMHLFAAQPVLGIGMQQFSSACAPLFHAGATTYCDIHPHNFYLQWLAEAGAIGLLLVLAFLSLLLLKAWRIFMSTHHLRLISLCLAIAALAGQTFPFVVTQSNFSNWSASIYWYALALTISVISFHQQGDRYG